MPVPKKEKWYTWRLLTTMEGEDNPRLLVPWSDPKTYEFPFNFLYETQEKAKEGLEIMGATDEAVEQNWILCKLTIEPV